MNSNLNFTENEILQYALSHDMLDLSNVVAKIEMNQREMILANHKHNIWEGSDGNWRTYLPNGNGRKLVKRKERVGVEEAIITHYRNTATGEKAVTTFKLCYDRMLETHSLSFTSPNTIFKYESDYKRFFKDTAFESMDIADINEETIRGFVLKKVKALKLPKKSCRDLCGYIRNTLKSARINRIISDNPFDYIEVKDFYPHCTERLKTPDERTVSDEEMALLYKKFQEDYLKRPAYIPTLAVEFASLTGFRVGEIAALKWEDISDDCITVSKAEKYSRVTGLHTIGDTKNRRTRIFPLTDEIRDLLMRIRETEERYGYLTEFVFSDENGRIFATKISDCAKVKSRQAGVPIKTIHSYRRTVSSKLKCNGVPSTVVSAMMGHSEQVNEHYYTYDVSDLQTKFSYVQTVTKALPKVITSNQK